MTMPRERKIAVKNTEAFLLALCDPKETPRVPEQSDYEQGHCSGIIQVTIIWKRLLS
jgi:hypothetical protein